MNNVDLYIVIVTFNGFRWIEKCLKSCKPYKVVIVDNNSNDGTVELIKQEYSNLILIEQKKNLGFGQANNLGISYALQMGAEYVFLLNQDAYLKKNTIEFLIDEAIKNPAFGILSPIHLNGSGRKLDNSFSVYANDNGNSIFFSDYVLERPINSVYEVPFVNAAFWLVTRKCLMTVGGFDPLFFHYGEDNNYCQRVIYHNLKVGFVPKAFGFHDREKRESRPHSNSALEIRERQFLLRYSNILDIDARRNMVRRLRIERHQVVRYVVQFRFGKALKYLKFYNTLVSQSRRIIKARTIIEKEGPSYLSM